MPGEGETLDDGLKLAEIDELGERLAEGDRDADALALGLRLALALDEGDKLALGLMEALAEACYRRGDAARDAHTDPRTQDFWNSCGHWNQAGVLALTGQWGRGKTLDNTPNGKKVMP